MKVKMISCMKHTKDRMDNPMDTGEMNGLLDVLKTTGATHIEVATVIGHSNFVDESVRWANAIHARGMKVTWRCAHINMEGLYGQPRFVGGNRKSVQFWIDEAVKAAEDIKHVVETNDEWAIFPERTEGIFSDSTAFIYDGLPGSYADFFIEMHKACGVVLPARMGMSANNASELLSGWMPASLINYAEVVVVDHYRDGNPEMYKAEIETIYSKYGYQVYVQEGAPHRFEAPTREQADAYFQVNKELDEAGILYGFGSWSGWAGNPESIVSTYDGGYKLNESGESLKAWWGGVVEPDPEPDPEPEPDPDPTPEPDVRYDSLALMFSLLAMFVALMALVIAIFA